MEKKLTSAEFLHEIELAQQWAIMINGVTGEVELWAREADDEEITKYAGPSFEGWTADRIISFLNSVRDLCQTDGIWARRFAPGPIGSQGIEMNMNNIRDDPERM